ncbi:Uncharacterised protein [Mycobacteroides abscessus]|nr:Uncharacterised protein [Mycobacteroides abscessus]
MTSLTGRRVPRSTSSVCSLALSVTHAVALYPSMAAPGSEPGPEAVPVSATSRCGSVSYRTGTPSRVVVAPSTSRSAFVGASTSTSDEPAGTVT